MVSICHKKLATLIVSLIKHRPNNRKKDRNNKSWFCSGTNLKLIFYIHRKWKCNWFLYEYFRAKCGPVTVKSETIFITRIQTLFFRFQKHDDVDSEKRRKWWCRAIESKQRHNITLWNACNKTIQVHHILFTVEVNIAHKITFTRSRLRLPRCSVRVLHIGQTSIYRHPICILWYLTLFASIERIWKERCIHHRTRTTYLLNDIPI